MFFLLAYTTHLFEVESFISCMAIQAATFERACARSTTSKTASKLFGLFIHQPLRLASHIQLTQMSPFGALAAGENRFALHEFYTYTEKTHALSCHDRCDSKTVRICTQAACMFIWRGAQYDCSRVCRQMPIAYDCMMFKHTCMTRKNKQA